MAPEAAGWLQIADQEMKAVRNNLFCPEPTTQIAAYHCQQAAEKMVKAILISTDIDPPHWHNIDDLIDLLPAARAIPSCARAVQSQANPFSPGTFEVPATFGDHGAQHRNRKETGGWQPI